MCQRQGPDPKRRLNDENHSDRTNPTPRRGRSPRFEVLQRPLWRVQAGRLVAMLNGSDEQVRLKASHAEPASGSQHVLAPAVRQNAVAKRFPHHRAMHSAEALATPKTEPNTGSAFA